MLEIVIPLAIGLIAALFLIFYFFNKYSKSEASVERRVREFLDKEEKRIRKDAISRSANTIVGKALEKLIPFLKDFKYDSRDIRWLGDPIDFVIFKGYGQFTASQKVEDITEIVICEIKSGKSRLSKEQRWIQTLIADKKITFEVFNLPESAPIVKEAVEAELANQSKEDQKTD